MNFLIRVLVVAAVSFGLAHLLSGVHVTDFWTAFVFAIVLALLNMFVRPILILVTLPVTFITLGLFLFVVIHLLLCWPASLLMVLALIISGGPCCSVLFYRS